MHILIANRSPIPVFAYGGTERVIWDLGRELTKLGHKITYLVPEGSYCDFAEIVPYNRKKPFKAQIPRGPDVVHFQYTPDFDADHDFDTPYIMTEHANVGGHGDAARRYLNTVFISQDHARRHNSNQFVYNGMDWDSYGPVDLERARTHYHFLAKASRAVKNLAGAVAVAAEAREKLAVLGGHRLSVNRGLRFTWSRAAQFYGMVGGAKKFELLNNSRGLIFPVRWHEPFGLAIIESQYFGAPVFGTTYGSLPELVPSDVGFLSNSCHELAEAVSRNKFNARTCHLFAKDNFNSALMAKRYLELYERVIAGEKLNKTAPFLSVQSLDLLPWNA